MRGKAHLACGVLTAAAVSGILFIIKDFSPVQCIAMSLACSVNSLVPDIDLPNSIAGSKIKPVSELINKIFGHRTITHAGLWLVFWAILASNLVIKPILFSLALGAGLGFLTHILTDTFTRGGVPWLWPFSRKRYHFTNINSGEHDWIFIVITVVAILSTTYFITNSDFQWLL